jgi:putative methyltransferase (TIGR04325 family)
MSYAFRINFPGGNRMNLTDFLPPILIKMAKRLKQTQDHQHVREFYNSYEDAFASCHNGYGDNGLINIVYEKTRIYKDALLKQSPLVSEMNALGILLGISLSLRGGELNVIDFGGACGAHYFLSKAIYGARIKLRWHVVETHAMVSKAVGLEDGQLKFFDDLSKAKNAFEHVDLMFSSGALQYVPMPYEFLEKLVECRASNIFITRVGL